MTMRRGSRITLISLASVVVLLIAARLVAPIFVLRFVNNTLQGLDGFTGHVADIELGLWRGAYVIKGLEIEKTTEQEPIPFVSIDRTDISVQWGPLLRGNLVGEIELYKPKLNLVAERKAESKAEDKVEQREQDRLAKGEETTWQTQVKELVPLDINRIAIVDGEFHYRDPYSNPKVDVPVKNIQGEVTNLTNSEALSEDLVARAKFHANALGSRNISISGSMDPYAQKPTFSLKAEAEELQFTKLNDFLKAYANVDAERGTLSIYAEVEAKNGGFKGYIKPLTRNLEILTWNKEKEGFFGKLWEGVIGVVKDVVENDEKKQVATRVPFSGRVDNPEADIFQTVLTVLENAFIEALRRGLEPVTGDEGGFSRRDTN